MLTRDMLTTQAVNTLEVLLLNYGSVDTALEDLNMTKVAYILANNGPVKYIPKNNPVLKVSGTSYKVFNIDAQLVYTNNSNVFGLSEYERLFIRNSAPGTLIYIYSNGTTILGVIGR